MKPPRHYASATAFRVALESRLKKMAVKCGLEPAMEKHFDVVAQFFSKVGP